MTALIVRGDARALPLPAASVDAVVCDPPYEIGFMGRGWDRAGVAFDPRTWVETLRVLKPGGHLLAFGGTRTYHRLACAVEDAGFEIRDSIGCLSWCYGSGFPKSLDVSKAIDKAASAERESVGLSRWAGRGSASDLGLINDDGWQPSQRAETAPATQDAARWAGWGTALKPAWEPIVVARKPLTGTVVQNVLTYGTGALHVDGCRVKHAGEADRRESEGKNRHADFGTGPRENRVYGADNRDRGQNGNYDGQPGRWPSNLLLVHHPDCAERCQPGCHVAEMDRQSGERPGAVSNGKRMGTGYRAGFGQQPQRPGPSDWGGASRFFPVFRYQAKAGAAERPRVTAGGRAVSHPTVKPVALMAWLVRLVCPPGGLVLDPFAGSGSTLRAARDEGFRAVGVELDADYCQLVRARLAAPARPAGRVAPATGQPLDGRVAGQLDLFESGPAPAA